MAKRRDPKQRLLTIKAPLGGVHRRSTYQEQPPFTAWDASNVWPEEPVNGRQRLSSRPGLEKVDATRPGTATVRMLAVLNQATQAGSTRLLLGSSGGNLYRWDGSGSWTQVTTSLSLASDRPIQAAPFGNKLYIADWGVEDSGTDGYLGTVGDTGSDGTTDGPGDYLDAASVSDWTSNSTNAVAFWLGGGADVGAHPVDTVTAGNITTTDDLSGEAVGQNFITVVPNATITRFVSPSLATLTGNISDYVLLIKEGANAGAYNIVAMNGENLTVTRADGATDSSTAAADNSDLNWAVVRSSKVYDADADTLSRWDATASKGSVPHGSKLITVWQDRMVMGNDGVDPHVWYMSRSGDPDDWLYGAENQGSPVSGNTFRAGLIGEPLTCVISHSLECCLIGSEDSLWVMRGDPLQGGYLERLSHLVGAVGPFAWTYSPKEELIIITSQGVQVITSICGNTPMEFSRLHLPVTFLDWGAASDTAVGAAVHAEFDVRFNGILITRDTTLAHDYWWIDWDQKGFWPMDVAVSEGVYLCRYPKMRLANQSDVAIGCEDGYVRRFDQAVLNDDGTEFDSYVEIGPIKISPSPFEKGGIVRMTGKMGQGSDPVIPTIRCGRDAESTAESQANEFMEFALTSWDGSDDKYQQNPHVSGHALILRLEKKNATAAAHWQFEEAHVVVRPLGVQR